MKWHQPLDPVGGVGCWQRSCWSSHESELLQQQLQPKRQLPWRPKLPGDQLPPGKRPDDDENSAAGEAAAVAVPESAAAAVAESGWSQEETFDAQSLVCESPVQSLKKPSAGKHFGDLFSHAQGIHTSAGFILHHYKKY